MASTNKTSYLNLNQWEPNDPVLREDFNADNAAVEAAAALVRLGSFTVPEDTPAITVDLTPYDLSRYQEIILSAQLKSADAANADNLTCQLNNVASGYMSLGTHDDSTYATGSSTELSGTNYISGLWVSFHQLRLTPTETGTMGQWQCRARIKASGASVSNQFRWNETGFFNESVTDDNLSSVRISGKNNNLAAGCRYTIYGLLK